MTVPSKPDDAALLELGRLIWSAISLEDVAYHMGDVIGLRSAEMKRGTIRECVKKVLSVLRTWPESEIREQAPRWFAAAQDALNARHHIVHSVPGTWVTVGDDRAFRPQGPVLEYLGRAEGSYRRFSMTEAGLRPVRQQLEDARAGWVEIYLALAEERKRLSPDDAARP